MIHLRVVSPSDITGAVLPFLDAEPAVMNLTVRPVAVSRPDGDAVDFDVLHGAANDVIRHLRDLGIGERGSITLVNVDTSISAVADRAIAARGRYREFTPVWAQVESRIALEGTFPPSWLTLLVIAGLIGAVGILTNSQILIVGAMVVGPEYGAILNLAFGMTRRDPARVRRSAMMLVIGFSLAVAAALLLSLIIRAAGLEPTAYAFGLRPVSDLIRSPNWFSVIVALLAGVVGIVSLTEARFGTLIGVFISVTTIPAASDVGVSLAFGSVNQAWGSLGQLVLNVLILTAVAIVGLPAQRALWRQVARRSARRAAALSMSGAPPGLVARNRPAPLSGSARHSSKNATLSYLPRNPIGLPSASASTQIRTSGAT